MALIKCIECEQNISTEAKMCPHCGRPNLNISEPRESKKFLKGILWNILIVAFLFFVAFGAFLIQERSKNYSGSGTFIGNVKQNLNNGNYNQVVSEILGSETIINNPLEIPLLEVKNLGYQFYVGQIDSAGNENITDDLKNQITKIAHTAHFPVGLLKTIPIIILNNLALTEGQYITTPTGKLPIPELKANFLSEGGICATYGNSSSVIFINKSTVTQGQLTEVLTHELGHAISNKLTNADWEKYYQLRNIPSTTPKSSTSWNLSPQEDFAEVYKNTYTGLGVQTYYGLLIPKAGMDFGKCMSIYFTVQRKYGYSMDNSSKISEDPQMQSCRREVMSNPSKYTTDWSIGAPYSSSVGPQTKSFISEIMGRLNSIK